MPTVYLTGTNPTRYRFHRTRDCWQLTKRHPRSKAEVKAVDLEDLDRAIPCQSCYPDAPDPKVFHRRCRLCNKKQVLPCPHNGGVAVPVTYTSKRRTLVSEPGDTWEETRYVWPENLHRYISA